MDFKELFQSLKDLKAPLIVGVSGGPDSLCLLYGLIEEDYQVLPVYFDHQIRSNSREESEQLAAQLEAWGLRLVVGRGDVPAAAEKEALSLEEAARNLRYRFLFQTAEEVRAGAVLVGHHADDQVETVLMHLLRGTGLSGLTGMEQVSIPNPWSESIPLIRPLLPVWQEEIIRCCERNQIRFMVDPTNRELVYLRNRIRQELVPLLETYNPGAKEHLFQTAQILQADQKILEKLENQLWQGLEPEYGSDWVRFRLGGFLELLVGMQRRLLKKAFQMLRPEGGDLSFRHLQTAVDYLNDGDHGSSQELVNLISLQVRGRKVYLAETGAELPPGHYPQMPDGEIYRLHLPGEYALGRGWVLEGLIREVEELEEGLVDQDPYRAILDSRLVGEELSVSGRREGERIQPLGMKAGTVKLADLMINEKIPAFARENWPIIRSAGKVIWIPGLRMAEFARVTDETEIVYVLTLTRRSAPAVQEEY